ncbi:MAG: MFS transporter [Syntrophomonadaceae bacterium]|nr:MFS transporter [Syntrophomonadaceae bacterium]
MEQELPQKFRSQRWLIWLALALAYFMGQFHRVSLNVMVDPIVRDFNLWDAAAVGGLAAAYFYAYAASQIPVGLMLDSWGARKTLLLGIFIACIGTIAFGLAQSLLVLQLSRVAIGVGVGVIFVGAAKTFNAWYRPLEFGTIIGLMLFVGNLGTLAATAPLALAVNLAGWREAYVLVGLLTACVLVFCWFKLRNDPQEAGWHFNSLGSQPQTALNFSQTIDLLKKVLKNPATWPPLIANSGIYGTLMVISGVWGVPFLMQVYDLSRPAAAGLMMMLSIGLMLGCPFTGYLSDWLCKRKLPYLILAAFYAVCWGILVLWPGGKPPLVSYYFIFFFLGFFSSAAMLSPMIAKELNDPAGTGVALSVGNIGPFVGVSVMQLLSGYILDWGWQGQIINGVKYYPLEAFHMAFAACGVVTVLVLGAVLLIKETGCQNVYSGDKGNSPQDSRLKRSCAQNC